MGWAGTPIAERRAERRLRLLRAGVALAGAGGLGALGVRAVCRHAGVTERYFYECFGDRDGFVVAVCEDAAAHARAAVAAAAASTEGPPGRARAVVEAFVELMVEDPWRGRVLLVDAASEPALAGWLAGAPVPFAVLVGEHLPTGDGPGAARLRAMAAAGMVGALAALFRSWLDGSLRVSRDELVDHAVAVVLAHVGLAAEPGHGSG